MKFSKQIMYNVTDPTHNNQQYHLKPVHEENWKKKNEKLMK